VRRIYPGFIASGLFCILIAGPLASPDHIAENALRNIRRILTLGEPIVPHIYASTMAAGHPNPVVWSIRYEFLCYAAVPLLAAAGALRRPSRAAWLFAAVYAYAAMLYATRGICPDGPRVLCCFLSGVVYWLFRSRVPLSRGLALASVGMLLLGCWRGFATVIPFAGAYLMFASAFHPGKLNNAARPGDLSYGIYLYGFPVQMLVMQLYRGGIGPLPLACLTLPLAASCAFVSWHVVEKPFLRARNRPSRTGYGEASERIRMSRNAAEV
jgi:peptidoglycan/LPS O-acetylase OafA/YrhL